jgi:hypothetical protein
MIRIYSRPKAMDFHPIHPEYPLKNNMLRFTVNRRRHEGHVNKVTMKMG